MGRGVLGTRVLPTLVAASGSLFLVFLAVWGCSDGGDLAPDGTNEETRVKTHNETLVVVGTYGRRAEPRIPNASWQPKHNFRSFADVDRTYYDDYLFLVGPVAEELAQVAKEYLDQGIRGIDVRIEGSPTGNIFSSVDDQSAEVELISFEIIR